MPPKRPSSRIAASRSIRRWLLFVVGFALPTGAAAEQAALTYVFVCPDQTEAVVRASESEAWVFRATGSLRLPAASGSPSRVYSDGSFELDAPSLSVGLPGATRRFCAEPEGLMQQEALYLEALRSASSLLLNGDRLELRTSDGALAVSLGRIAGE